jgi:hypothetical protein
MSASRSDHRGSVDLPIPQSDLVEARLKGFQARGDLEVSLRGRDREEPQELDVTITNMARLQLGTVGVREADQQVVAT